MVPQRCPGKGFQIKEKIRMAGRTKKSQPEQAAEEKGTQPVKAAAKTKTQSSKAAAKTKTQLSEAAAKTKTQSSKTTGRKKTQPSKAAAKKKDEAFITELDQYLFGTGTHYEIFKKLGAHPTERAGKKGTHFAVWAPNAKEDDPLSPDR